MLRNHETLDRMDDILDFSKPGTWVFRSRLRELSEQYIIWARLNSTRRPGILRYDPTDVEEHALCDRTREHSHCRVMIDVDTGHGSLSTHTVDVKEVTVCTPSKKHEFVMQIVGLEEDIGKLYLVRTIRPARGDIPKLGVTTFEDHLTIKELPAFLFTRTTKRNTVQS